MAKMFIAGESVDAISGATYQVHNPANGEVVDTAPKGNENDARRAVDAAGCPGGQLVGAPRVVVERAS